jgi:hypothetical protein
MPKKIYGLICDGGDGSAHLQWFSDEAEVKMRLECDDADTDEDYGYLYGMNEGSPAITLTVDATFDFKGAGIYYIDGQSVDQFVD